MRNVLVAVIFGSLAVACGNPSGPRSGLNILSGDNMSDTVGSVLHPPLTVELLDGDLQPISGDTVYFSSGGPVLVAPINDPGFVINRLPAITDASGQAAVWVEFKTSVAPGVVTASANGQAVQAHYTVLPGSAAHVRADPSDTALYVGGTETFRPYITDAYGNRRSDTPTYQYTNLSSALSVSTSGKATGVTFGRGSVALTALGFTDTLWVSVVPKGRVAALQGPGLPGYVVVTNLDGSSFDTIPRSLFLIGSTLDWSPVGDTLVLDAYTPRTLVTIDLAGQVTRVFTSSPLLNQYYPRYAHDRSYVYFTGIDAVTRCYGLWRVRPAGTSLEHVVTDTIACPQF